MATVSELTARYEDFMLSPRPGPDVCGVCFNLTDGYERCWACTHGGRFLDAVAPISYSVAGEPLHHALASYKRQADAEVGRLGAELAAVLWRHLQTHERCLARAVGVDSFDLVTTVPSSDRTRDDGHPLRRLVGQTVRPTRDRYTRLLRRSPAAVHHHQFSAERYESDVELAGQAVLLVDDMWTTGANAQSAAAALKHSGAGAVAAVVIGRHLNREWRHNDRRIRSFERPFDWRRCARCEANEIEGLRGAM
jgi:predicted amidophosphoribosyltransferase